VRTSMKACVLGMVLAVCAAAAHANSINDPRIIVRDPVGCPSNACVTLTGLTFNFQVPSSGFGNLHFLNSTGVTFTSLIFTETGVAAANISCAADVFSCAVVAFGQNGAKIVLTATGGFTGIPNGNSFEILLSCVNSNCWPGGMNIDAAANAVPEPATMALMLTGLGALVTRRKLRARIAA
jgi:PEP-CTERM motif